MVIVPFPVHLVHLTEVYQSYFNCAVICKKVKKSKGSPYSITECTVPGHSAPESNTLTTRLPSHSMACRCNMQFVKIAVHTVWRLVAWLSGRTSVSGRRTFPVLRSTCSWWVTTNVGKPSATGQPTRPTHPFILSGSIKWVVSWSQMCAAVYR